MAPTIVLITGANRGIGRGILELYLQKPNHTIIAANRDPSHPTSQELLSLPTADGTTVRVVKNDATVPTDAAEAVKELASHGITHLDIVIANAAVAYLFPKVHEVKTEDIQRHIVPNVYGFIWLYQATLPLLNAAQAPKWVTIGSSAAYLTNAAYGPTKLMVHYYTKAIHNEQPSLIAFPIDPGWVQTELGNRGAHLMGVKEATTTIRDSTTGVVKVIDEATMDSHSGKLWTWEGKVVAW